MFENVHIDIRTTRSSFYLLVVKYSVDSKYGIISYLSSIVKLNITVSTAPSLNDTGVYLASCFALKATTALHIV